MSARNVVEASSVSGNMTFTISFPLLASGHHLIINTTDQFNTLSKSYVYDTNSICKDFILSSCVNSFYGNKVF